MAFVAGAIAAGTGFAGAVAGVWANAAIGTARAEARTSRAKRGRNDGWNISEASLPVGKCGITLRKKYGARAGKFPPRPKTESRRPGP